MKFNADFFLWIKFAIEAIKIFIKLFGDDEEKETAAKNGFSP